jgi:hypothetical protein
MALKKHLVLINFILEKQESERKELNIWTPDPKKREGFI